MTIASVYGSCYGPHNPSSTNGAGVLQESVILGPLIGQKHENAVVLGCEAILISMFAAQKPPRWVSRQRRLSGQGSTAKRPAFDSTSRRVCAWSAGAKRHPSSRDRRRVSVAELIPRAAPKYACSYCASYIMNDGSVDSVEHQSRNDGRTMVQSIKGASPSALIEQD